MVNGNRDVPDLTDRNHSPAPLLARLGTWFLCTIWLLAGTLGHDPWKPDDVLHLGVAFGMAGGDCLVPRIAGDPWLVSPPLTDTVIGSVTWRSAPSTVNSSGMTLRVTDETKAIMRWPARSSGVWGMPKRAR